MKEDEFPALYVLADSNSGKAQKSFLVALIASLACLAAASLLSTLNVPNIWFAGLQVLVLLASLGLTVFLANSKPQKLWYGSRALAESVKTVAWRYMMRAEPFNLPDADVRPHFVSVLRRILDDNRSISSLSGQGFGSKQITARMDHTRALPLANRTEFYRKYRIVDQLNWYSKKAQNNRKLAKRWFGGIIVLHALAIVFAVGKMFFPDVDIWPTDFVVTVAGAVMAWVQTKRYQELAASYALTAHEISLLEEVVPTDGLEKTFSDFVGDAENAFSREHTQWQARRDQD